MVLGAPGTIAIAAFIGPAAKGVLATLIAVSLIAATILSLGMDGAIRYYLATRSWTLAESNMIAVGFTVAAGAIAFFGFEGVRAIAPRGLLTGLSSVHLAAATGTVMLGMLAGQSLLALREFKLFARLSVLSSVANPVLFVILAFCGVSSLHAALWAWIGAQATVAIPSQIVLLRRSGWRLARPSDSRGALSYGLRSVGWDLLNLVNLRLDVLMLRSLSSAASTGSYAMATQLTEVVWVVPTSVGVAVFPEIADGGHDDGAWTARVCRLTSVLSGLLCLAVGIAGTVLLAVIMPAYRAAVPALWLLLPGTAFAATTKILNNDLSARRRPHAALVAAAVAVLVTIVGDLLLVPVLGATGAALVSSVAYIICALVLVWFFVSATKSRAAELVPRMSDVGEALRLAVRTVKDFMTPRPEEEEE
jgi:O-antigen/teichoic acid export membrane protein